MISDNLMEYLYNNSLDMQFECPDDECLKNECVENNEEDLQANPIKLICIECWRKYLESK